MDIVCKELRGITPYPKASLKLHDRKGLGTPKCEIIIVLLPHSAGLRNPITLWVHATFVSNRQNMAEVMHGWSGHSRNRSCMQQFKRLHDSFLELAQ